MKSKRIFKALTGITAIFLLSMVFVLLPAAESSPEGIRVPVKVSFTVADPPADAAGKSFNFEVTTLDGAPQPDTERFALTDGGSGDALSIADFSELRELYPDVYGQSSLYGRIFMDYRCSSNFSVALTVIYRWCVTHNTV